MYSIVYEDYRSLPKLPAKDHTIFCRRLDFLITKCRLHEFHGLHTRQIDAMHNKVRLKPYIIIIIKNVSEAKHFFSDMTMWLLYKLYTLHYWINESVLEFWADSFIRYQLVWNFARKMHFFYLSQQISSVKNQVLQLIKVTWMKDKHSLRGFL